MILLIQEINQKYDGEWVFLINCTADEKGNINTGEVAIHSKSRDEVFREMQKYRAVDTLSSIRYVGKVPEGVVVIL